MTDLENYYISTNREKLDIDFIHDFLTNSYWAKGRPKRIVEKSIENCLCFGIYHTNGGQVGFARVMTDYSIFAYIADVFIDKKHRGKGLSKYLMEAILKNEELQDVTKWSLKTLDAYKLYEKFGFKKPQNEIHYMEMSR